MTAVAPLSRLETDDSPSETRVVGSSSLPAACAWLFDSEHVDLRQENGSIGTATVSGVWCWLSKDPIGIAGGLNQYSFVYNNPITFRDPFGLAPPIPIDQLPDGLDFSANIAEATNMSMAGFAWASRNGGRWDIRGQFLDKCSLSRSDLTNLGNYNFGLTGAAAGFSRTTLGFAGDWDQGVSRKWLPAYGPWPTDNPVDAYWINEGYNDYINGYWNQPEESAK